jgi:hypothetical protein
MKRMLIAGLLALGGLAGAVTPVQAEGCVLYYPYGWYIPKGSCWVRFHGCREPWAPPSGTEWTVCNPLRPGAPNGCLPPAGPQIPFQPLGFLPPAPHDDNGWCYGKQTGYKPTLKQLIPNCQPAYLP